MKYTLNYFQKQLQLFTQNYFNILLLIYDYMIICVLLCSTKDIHNKGKYAHL